MKDKQKIENLDLETIMNQRFSRYTKSIIQERALPRVEDGLKPVQRRILYAMWKSGNTYNKAYRKSAKAVGDVMGNFHPHGDSSIYEALIHMSQDWKMRLPLIDLHGNNGSIDDDPPAAMRYTESRLSQASNEMMRDIDKDTVTWTWNFDDTEYEPMVLPSRFPNLIVNGAMGIASGYATQIPPHNLGEVINALVYLQYHPNADLDDLMHFIKGPDFPTGGVIQGINGLKKAYQTGRGKIIVRARSKIENIRGGRQRIHISEIPYGVNKKQLVHHMDIIRINHKINGIAEVRDDTDRHGLSIVVELKRNADAKGILNYLYKNTDLQITYHFNVIAIDHQEPKLLSLKSILSSYLEFQRDLISNRTKYDLRKLSQKQEIVEGLIKALGVINKVIRIVRDSNSRANASNNLVNMLHFTKRQADSIVALRLYRLTNTSNVALKAENKVLNMKAKYYHDILNDPRKLDTVLRMELRSIQRRYATPRKTKIENHVQRLHISKQVTIPNEDVVVLVSHDGYIKRSSWRSYKASRSGFNGLKPVDYPLFTERLNTRNYIFLFTNQGRLIFRPVNDIKEVKWRDTGENISQSIKMQKGERIIDVYGFKSLKSVGTFLVETNDGYIKQTKFKDLVPGRTYRHHASTYVRLKNNNSRVVNVMYLPNKMPKCSVILMSKLGFILRFNLKQVPTVGSNAAGVKSMNLKNNDKVMDVQIVNNNSIIGVLTTQGTFSLLPVSLVSVSNRNRRGVHAIYHTKSNQHTLSDFAIINPLSNTPLKTYTAFKQEQDIDLSNLNLSQLAGRGKKVVNIKKNGVPVCLRY